MFLDVGPVESGASGEDRRDVVEIMGPPGDELVHDHVLRRQHPTDGAFEGENLIVGLREQQVELVSAPPSRHEIRPLAVAHHPDLASGSPQRIGRTVETEGEEIEVARETDVESVEVRSMGADDDGLDPGLVEDTAQITG